MADQPFEEIFDGTFCHLWSLISTGPDLQRRDQVQTVLAATSDRLFLALDAFTECSESSRIKLEKPITFGIGSSTFTLTPLERMLVAKLSDIHSLNQVQCAIIWNRFRNSNPHLVSKFLDNASNATFDSSSTEALQRQFASAYFDERIALLQCFIWLLQKAVVDEDDDSMCKEILSTADRYTVMDSLLQQFARLVRQPLPNFFASSSSLAEDYAFQVLKEEMYVLRIMILYTYDQQGYQPTTTSHLVNHFREMEANTFGENQQIKLVMEQSHPSLFAQVSQMCVLLSTSLLQPSKHVAAALKNAPGDLVTINNIMSFLGNHQVHGLPLLAWSKVLYDFQAFDVTDVNVKSMFSGSSVPSTNSLMPPAQRPRQQQSGIEKPVVPQTPTLYQNYLECAVSVNTFHYISTFFENDSQLQMANAQSIAIYDCIRDFLEMYDVSFLRPDDTATLIESICQVVQYLPSTELDAFWKSRQFISFLDTLRSDWPKDPNQLVRLLSCLSHQETSAEQAFDYFCRLPGLPLLLRYVPRGQGIIKVLPAIILQEQRGITHLVLQSANCTALDERLVHYHGCCSGWHFVLSVLGQFITSDYDEVDVDIPSLCRPAFTTALAMIKWLEKVLSHSKLAVRLVEHLDSFRINDSDPKTHGLLLDLLFALVNRLGAQTSQIPLSLLTSTVNCLVLMLRNHFLERALHCKIWKYIGHSPLFPRPLAYDPLLMASFTHVPMRQFGEHLTSHLDYIIKNVETEIGDYNLLLTYLNLMDACLCDLVFHWNMPASEYQIQVMFGFIQFALSQILPFYGHWRYKNVLQKFKIGSMVIQLLEDIERHLQCGELSHLRDMVIHRLAYDERTSPLYTRSILSAVINFLSQVDVFISNNQFAESDELEKLVRSSLNLFKILMQRQLFQVPSISDGQSNRNSLPLLTQLCLQYLGESNGSKTTYLHHISSLIQFDDPRIQVLGINIFCLVCQTCNKFSGAPINLVQYIAETDQLQLTIQSYLKVAGNIYLHETLLTACWQMLTLVLEIQPSLGLLFLDCSGDSIMPSPKTAVVRQHQENMPSTTSSNPSSALRVAQDMLANWQILATTKPSVLSNVLRFLATFWLKAYDHFAMVQRVRSDSSLWQHLEAILFNISSDQMDQSEGESSLQYECCMNLDRAFILLLMSYEIQSTGTAMAEKNCTTSEGLSSGLRNILIKMGDQKKLTWILKQFNTASPDELRLAFDLEQQGQIIFDMINQYSQNSGATQLVGYRDNSLNQCYLLPLNPPSLFGGDTVMIANDTTDFGHVVIDDTYGRQYGNSYLYDTYLAALRLQCLSQQLDPHARHKETSVTTEVYQLQKIENAYNSYISVMAAANRQWSIADSKQILLSACRSLVSMASSVVYDVVWSSQDNKVLYFLVSILEQVPDMEGHAAYDALRLVRSVLSDWINRSSTTNGMQEIVEKLCRITTAHSLVDECLALCLAHAEAVSMESLVAALSRVCEQFVDLVTSCDLNTSETIKNVAISLTLLCRLTKLLHVESWLPVFVKYQCIPSLLKLANQGLYQLMADFTTETRQASRIYFSPHAENAFILLVAISHIPLAADELHRHDVLDFLCNNALSKTLELGEMDFLFRYNGNQDAGVSHFSTKATPIASSHIESVEQSPLHSIWLQMLIIVANLVRSNPNNQSLRQCVLFVQKYGKQIDRAFAVATDNDGAIGLRPSESLSSPVMAEVEWITSILYSLSKRWLEVLPYGKTLFQSFRKCGLQLVRRYFQILLKPNHLHASLYPINNQEIEDLKVKDNDHAYPKLMINTQGCIYRIVDLTLSSMVILTDAARIVSEHNPESWPCGNIILQNNTKSEPSPIPAFYQLHEWMVGMLSELNNNKTDEAQIKKILEASLTLYCTQLALSIKCPGIGNTSGDLRALADHLKPILHFIQKLQAAEATSQSPLLFALKKFIVYHFFAVK
ncbi:hypothetical protein DM01DRAFT_1411307 [Hesseltinella vesiculosa]|uniref:Nucleoporin Nup188 N-terminal subdomain III domain-containing protein n=1 Tax=Hesseltinella vesiculosa TaxID=101127 RepID=A0A1X2G463_9FUNG|nr:hypothetical protein DM01DRAFT_1411307 [Hesseltinella vesiculosa]